MTEYNQDFQMKSGDDRVLRFTNTDDGGGALDLTVGTLKWGLSPVKGFSGVTTVSKSSGSGIAIEGAPTLGICLVDLDPADTAALKGRFIQELEYTDGAGKVSTLSTGVGKIIADMAFP